MKKQLRASSAWTLPTLLLPHPTAAADDNTVTMPKAEIVGIAPVSGLGIDREILPYPVQAAT